MIVVSILITGLYVLLMLYLNKGQKKLKPFVLKSQPNTIRFSIIVPFRDEAKNLIVLLQSLADLDYPKDQFEIILINDFSSDNYKPIIEKFKEALPNLRCIDAEVSDISPKKAALSLGISKAKYDWILTTDADCTIPKNWLKFYSQKIINDKPILIAGLVKFNDTKTFLNRFQCLDLLSLQAALLGTFGQHKPILCHGANLCYSKNVFYELNGFKSHQDIASGDDVFLLEAAFKKYPDKVTVLNSLEATVSTQTEPTFKKLVSQRTRWAAKALAYKNASIKIVGLIIFTMNLLLIILSILSLLGVFNAQLFWLIFLVKFNIDALILYRTARYFKQESVLNGYILSSFVYPFFSVISVLLGLLSGFNWKGRHFKR